MGYCQSCHRDAADCRKKPSVQKQTFKARPKAVQPENLVIFVLGGPGSGKGTQCQQIAEEYGFVHFSVGEMLRDELSRDSDIGKKAKMAMEEGTLVPVEVTLMILKNAMEKSANKRFLLDGFPRAVNQAKAFEEKICKPDMVLYLECDSKVMEERILQRGKTSGRIDDNVETIKKRLKTFEEETLPVIQYNDDPDKDVLIKVNSNRPSAEVFSDIATALKELFSFEPASSKSSMIAIRQS